MAITKAEARAKLSLDKRDYDAKIYEAQRQARRLGTTWQRVSGAFRIMPLARGFGALAGSMFTVHGAILSLAGAAFMWHRRMRDAKREAEELDKRVLTGLAENFSALTKGEINSATEALKKFGFTATNGLVDARTMLEQLKSRMDAIGGGADAAATAVRAMGGDTREAMEKLGLGPEKYVKEPVAHPLVGGLASMNKITSANRKVTWDLLPHGDDYERRAGEYEAGLKKLNDQKARDEKNAPARARAEQEVLRNRLASLPLEERQSALQGEIAGFAEDIRMAAEDSSKVTAENISQVIRLLTLKRDEAAIGESLKKQAQERLVAISKANDAIARAQRQSSDRFGLTVSELADPERPVFTRGGAIQRMMAQAVQYHEGMMRQARAEGIDPSAPGFAFHQGWVDQLRRGMTGLTTAERNPGEQLEEANKHLTELEKMFKDTGGKVIPVMGE